MKLKKLELDTYSIYNSNNLTNTYIAVTHFQAHLKSIVLANLIL